MIKLTRWQLDDGKLVLQIFIWKTLQSKKKELNNNFLQPGHLNITFIPHCKVCNLKAS